MTAVEDTCELNEIFKKYLKCIQQEIPFNAITQRDYEYIHAFPHIVTLNLDLPRVYLFITKYKGSNRCIYFKDNEIIFDNHRFSEEMFHKDTLFIGYLYDRVYTVEDILISEGRPVNGLGLGLGLGLDKRISLINSILDYAYVPDPVLESYQIIAKEYVEYEYLQSFYINHASKLPYSQYINGLRFCPLQTGRQIIINRNTEIPTVVKKIKDKIGQYEGRHAIISEPSIEECVFHIKKTDKPDVYELYLFDSDKILRYYDIACIPNKIISSKITKLFSHARISETSMNCTFNKDFKRWTPVSITYAYPYFLINGEIREL